MTGAAGFIGSALAERLVRDGHQVTGIDNFSGCYGRRIKESNVRRLVRDENFSLLELDINHADLAAVLDGVDIVFHEAGQAGVRTSWGADFAEYADANILATQRLLEAVRQTTPNLTRFVFASSSSVYGVAKRYPTDESDLPQPHSPYGVTKLAAEHLVSVYATHFGIPAVSLRYFTVFGPRQRPDMAFSRFIASARLGEPVSVYGDGNQIREFTFVDDVVEGNVLAIGATLEPGTVINLAGGAATSLNDVLCLLERIHGRPIRINRVEAALGDVDRTGGSTEKARTLLGWAPRVSMEDGLALQYDWYASQVQPSG